MKPTILVSYDDTANDRDALALGRRLAAAGGSLALAYVCHPRAGDLGGELLEGHAAEQLLERGARSIGAADAERHLVAHASTGDGLRELAERRHVAVVVFGSDYRTAPGSVRPGTSAQRLLAGGPAAVALAPAGLRARDDAIARVGVLADAADTAAEETATDIAEAFGAEIMTGGGAVDLLVVGSRPSTPVGRVALSAAAEYAIETAASSVLVVPAGSPVRLRPRAFSAA
jgi:nucleotide-binding universal stress UspA family protein